MSFPSPVQGNPSTTGSQPSYSRFAANAGSLVLDVALAILGGNQSQQLALGMPPIISVPPAAPAMPFLPDVIPVPPSFPPTMPPIPPIMPGPLSPPKHPPEPPHPHIPDDDK